MTKIKYFLPVLIAACLLGCRKYAEQPNLKSPAYLRVFNDVATYPNILHTGQINPYLTFLMDPVLDKAGIPQNGSIVGDFLGTRQLYTVSYPYDAANTTVAAGTTNYEYPGRSHVLTAPSINGLDLSSWAQIPAGTHRILFVVRPVNDTPFTKLSLNQRSIILIDTTVTFQAGEVYTMEAVLKDADRNAYGAYVRMEDFTHHPFSADSLYVNFFNLSTAKPQNANSDLSEYYGWLSDTLTVASNYYSYDYGGQGFDTIPHLANLSLQLVQHFGTKATYYTLPFLSKSSFFDPQNNLGTYDTGDVAVCCGDYKVGGTLPYFGLNFLTNSGKKINIAFNVSPDNFNNLYPASVQFGLNGNRAFNAYEALPNLNLITDINNQYTIYPTLTILEGVNDRVFMMQIQSGFKQQP